MYYKKIEKDEFTMRWGDHLFAMKTRWIIGAIAFSFVVAGLFILPTKIDMPLIYAQGARILGTVGAITIVLLFIYGILHDIRRA